MPSIEFPFHDAIRDCILNEVYSYNDANDWFEWRHCYEGGAKFREEFLEEFPGKEDNDAFERRKRLTPLSPFAKRAINRVRNSLAQRLQDISRSGGSDRWAEAINGKRRGIDRRGSEINTYLAKNILAEMLVMGQVGVLVDAPKGNFRSRAEVPETFGPYLQTFARENYPVLIPAPEDSVSDWSSVLLKVTHRKFNLITGKNDCVNEWRYYWLEDDEIERFGKVNVAFMDDSGETTRDIVKTNLDAIPFVLFDIGQSLMSDVCFHQIALLNIVSADSNYVMDANYTVLTRQRGNAGTAGDHLEGGDGEDVVKTGAQKGIWYGKGYERPGFISPSTEPVALSLEVRRELKKEIHELVQGVVEGMAEDGSVEDGLAFIGQCMQTAERRIWDHWVVFEEVRESRREVPTVHYPADWSLMTTEERLEAATKFMQLANVMVGRKNKQAMAMTAADKLHRGKMSTEELNEIKAEIEDAPYAISDPTVIFKAKKEGLMCAETGSLALGNLPGEAEKAEEDAAKRAAMVVAAQTDAAEGAARGNEDGSVDPNSNELAREGETEGAANLRDTREPGRPNEEEQEEGD